MPMPIAKSSSSEPKKKSRLVLLSQPLTPPPTPPSRSTSLCTNKSLDINLIIARYEQQRKLQRECDLLKDEVMDLAHFNYAREPEFVRDRVKLRQTLDEVVALKQKLTSCHLEPILDKLTRAQEKLSDQARKQEEESEEMAQKFLDSQMGHEQFLQQYINLRKETCRTRTLADKLSKEREKLEETVGLKVISPKRPPRK